MAISPLTPKPGTGLDQHPLNAAVVGGLDIRRQPFFAQDLVGHFHDEVIRLEQAVLREAGSVAENGNVKILTSCPSCLQGLSRYGDDLQNGLLEADYIVVEMANQILGKEWLPTYVEAANHGGIERVLV